MFDAARMSQDKPVWWLHCENAKCTEIQHFIGGVDQLQDRAASRRGRVYPDKLRQGNASLFIENVQMSDEGHYECSAILTDSPCTTIYVLTVLASYEPPQLTEALDTRSFTCSSRNGFPPALVTWTGGSGMNYTPDSVTQHTLNPEGLYDVVSKLTRNFTEEETICCTVWNQPLQEHKTNCMQVTPGRQNLATKRERISNCSDDTAIILIGKPKHGVPSLINSCVFAYKAEEPFANLAGAEKGPPHYAQPEEVPLTEHITITRALLQPEDRFWTSERDSYLDKWRREEQSHRRPFVFVHSCIDKLTATTKDEIQKLFEDVKSVSGGTEIRAVRGNGVWINCTFDPARMKRGNVPVSWYQRQGNGSRRVQHYENGVDHLQHRAASRRGRIYPDKFKEGNASLFIENVQMSDEGHYECVVVLKDGVTSEISVLTVLASSEPPQLTEALDARSFTCSSRNGFPPALVTWTGGSGMNYTPDSVTQHTLNPEGLYDVLTCLNLTRKRMQISAFSHHTVTPVLIGKPQYGVPSLINSCVFAYKAEEPFANWAGAEKDPPHYAQPEEVPLSEHITITRALLQPEDRFWTSERDSYLDKWRREAQSHRRPFVFVHRMKLFAFGLILLVGTEIQHYENGVDLLQDRAASRRGRVYPDKFREGNASLFIENVQMSDEGHYECSAVAIERLYTKSSGLTVLASYEPPQLTEALDTRSFTCSSRNGFPPALVTWTGGSGMNYTPDSVTQHTLNPEGLYDVVSKLTRNFTEEETICCTVWNQPLQEHKTNCMQVTPGKCVIHLQHNSGGIAYCVKKLVFK
ncbi:UNVERIFIED_CONTAM: hypothetical protein FKN15_002265 [Acipenser sinensis]